MLGLFYLFTRGESPAENHNYCYNGSKNLAVQHQRPFSTIRLKMAERRVFMGWLES